MSDRCFRTAWNNSATTGRNSFKFFIRDNILISVEKIPFFSNNSILFNPLNSKLIPIYHLLALLGVQPILHISRIRVKIVTKLSNYMIWYDMIHDMIYDVM